MLNTLKSQKTQIKTSLRQHYNRLKRRLRTPNAGKREEQTELSYIAGRRVLGTVLWKNICKFLLKLNSQLSYGLAILPLNIYLRKMKTMPIRRHTQMFTAAY